MAQSPRPPFAMLVVTEQKSLGREPAETQYLIRQLAQAGVAVWGYMEAKSLTPRSWMDKALSALRGSADEAHREDTSRRVTDKHKEKFKEGKVVGGRVFGYRNRHFYNGVDRDGNPAAATRSATSILRKRRWFAASSLQFVRKGDTRGTEHITPADTFDEDYSRLLQAAQRTGEMARPAGFEPATFGSGGHNPLH